MLGHNRHDRAGTMDARHRLAAVWGEVGQGSHRSKSGPHPAMRGAGRQVASSQVVKDAGPPASRAAISVRPGPALLPRRIACPALAVSAPRLSLTLVLPELRRSTERAGLLGASTSLRMRSLLRRSDLPSLWTAYPEPQAPIPAPHSDASMGLFELEPIVMTGVLPLLE